jgi:2-phosphosulfolactate phosphatase
VKRPRGAALARGERAAHQMEIVHADGVEGAREARGLVVVIDVLRAFTVSACALAAGASRCVLVREVAEAHALSRTIPDSVVSAEVDGLPVPGVPISNSPTMVASAALAGMTLIQRSSAGTQGAVAAAAADRVLAGSLVVARATARCINRLEPWRVVLVATGAPDGHPEDRACADYITALVRGEEPDLDALLAPLRDSERYRRMRAGEVPGFPPSDLSLALAADRFDFVMAVTREDGLVVLRKLSVDEL